MELEGKCSLQSLGSGRGRFLCCYLADNHSPATSPRAWQPSNGAQDSPPSHSPTTLVDQALLLSQPHDVLSQVVTLHLDTGLVVGELVHLPAQLPHLLLIQVAQARLALALELLKLGQQNFVLLLQEAHFVDVVGEAVIQLLQFHLLVGASVLELGVDGVCQREVHRVLQQPHAGHAAPQAHRRGPGHIGATRG